MKMALPIQSSSFATKPFGLVHNSLLLLPTRTRFVIKSQNPPEAQNPPVNGESTDESSPVLVPPEKPSSSGLGFGSSSSSSTKSAATTGGTEKKQKKGRERASVIRRSPMARPAFASQQEEGQSKELGRNESTFLLAWLGLGSIILVEGIVLAASGFLPEEWDKFFVKYLYPSFTPTVILFLAGTVVYGVSKYLQNEKLKGQK
ncbi:protein LPA2 [Malania oleifera]|uniref:protein LPA2 n=1 Tax=Malania oleifera TaxID=397392 RepID=UPI0025AE1912|nr:protein LPA2 [Malania oleifera]